MQMTMGESGAANAAARPFDEFREVEQECGFDLVFGGFLGSPGDAEYTKPDAHGQRRATGPRAASIAGNGWGSPAPCRSSVDVSDDAADRSAILEMPRLEEVLSHER